jgi:hypothetical protein
VDQIALPFRIALVAILAAGALWLTVLKPKDPTAEPPTAPGVTGLTTATDKARGAVSTANAAAGAAAATGADAATATTTPASTTPTPAAKAQAAAKARAAGPPKGVAANDPSLPLVRAVDRGKVVVVLFANGRSADDRAVRRAVARVSTHGGAVVKVVREIRAVGRYEALTAGADVSESPTVLVVAPNRTARTIVGLTTRAEVGQLVADRLATARKAARKAARP